MQSTNTNNTLETTKNKSYHPDAEPKINCLVADFLPTSLIIFSTKDLASSAVFSKSNSSDVDGPSSFLFTADGAISIKIKKKIRSEDIL